ncbi:hypothetical protein BaRGS_00002387, partial [Batillaria attramentaria]
TWAYTVEVQLFVDTEAQTKWKKATGEGDTSKAKDQIKEYLKSIFKGVRLCSILPNNNYPEKLSSDSEFIPSRSEVNEAFATTSKYGLDVDVRMVGEPIFPSGAICDTPYLGDSRATQENQCLDKFRAWAVTTYPSSTADHFMLFTGYDIADKNSEGTIERDTAGIAFMSGVCGHIKTSVVEMAFDGSVISTTAHELAHNLGSDHDGGSSPPTNCALGYVMDPGGKGIRKETNFAFSECSAKMMKATLANKACVSQTTAPAFSESGARDFGQQYDPDTQCKHIYNYKGFLAGKTLSGYFPRKCKNGQCVADSTLPAGDDYCVYGEGPFAFLGDKTYKTCGQVDSSVCSSKTGKYNCCKKCRPGEDVWFTASQRSCAGRHGPPETTRTMTITKPSKRAKEEAVTGLLLHTDRYDILKSWSSEQDKLQKVFLEDMEETFSISLRDEPQLIRTEVPPFYVRDIAHHQRLQADILHLVGCSSRIIRLTVTQNGAELLTESLVYVRETRTVIAGGVGLLKAICLSGLECSLSVESKVDVESTLGKSEMVYDVVVDSRYKRLLVTLKQTHAFDDKRTGTITCCALYRRAEYIFTGYENGKVKVWDTTMTRKVHEFSDHCDKVIGRQKCSQYRVVRCEGRFKLLRMGEKLYRMGVLKDCGAAGFWFQTSNRILFYELND